MHKMLQYICDELEALERKAEKEGKLSMSEVQYADTLLHMKKNLLKAEEMYDEGNYSGARMGTSRGALGNYSRRDARGRYSMSAGDLVEQVRDLMHDAPDDRTRQEFQRFIEKLERM